jgi:hypothetical protein
MPGVLRNRKRLASFALYSLLNRQEMIEEMLLIQIGIGHKFFQLMKSSPEYNNLQYGLACAMKWYNMYIIA